MFLEYLFIVIFNLYIFNSDRRKECIVYNLLCVFYLLCVKNLLTRNLIPEDQFQGQFIVVNFCLINKSFFDFSSSFLNGGNDENTSIFTL